MALLVATVAAATFLPWGESVYRSTGFALLWAVAAVSAAALMIRKRMWKRPLLLALHGSLLLILLGGGITHLTGLKGAIHLRQGVPSDQVQLADGSTTRLPHPIELQRFGIAYYPGTRTPQDYRSTVRYRGEERVISMNNILRADGWRFYQTDYDPDEQGVLLSVNRDPWGIGITYAGYALFGLCAMGCTLRKWRHGALALALPLMLLPGRSDAAALPVISRQQADSLDRAQVIWNGRVTPFGTLSHDFVQKLYGKPSYRDLTATQVVVSWTLAPEAWNRQPLIRLKDDATARLLGVSGRYACLADFFDADGKYKLPASAPGRGAREADEKAGLAIMLLQGTLVEEATDPPHLSEQRVTAELWYNRIPWTHISFVACFVMAALALFFRHPAWCALMAAWTGLNLALRWYISGHLPIVSGYETMLATAFCVSLTAAFLARRHPIAAPTGLLAAGCLLLVSHLGAKTPRMSAMMPVLHSPWLSAHVSVIMISYALFSVMTVLSLYTLLRGGEERTRRTAALCRRCLFPANFLLGAGIFLGAVWANVSWGDYWTWDPKESWALVTFMVYAAGFHTESIPFMGKPRGFLVYIAAAYLTVLMTWLGVNHLLGGMHSYGG